ICIGANNRLLLGFVDERTLAPGLPDCETGERSDSSPERGSYWDGSRPVEAQNVARSAPTRRRAQSSAASGPDRRSDQGRPLRRSPSDTIYLLNILPLNLGRFATARKRQPILGNVAQFSFQGPTILQLDGQSLSGMNCHDRRPVAI